jgi:hypothetical protein
VGNFKISSTYVVNKKLDLPVSYKIRNGIVIVDIKNLVDTIMDEEGIAKYKTEKMSLNIPFNSQKQVTGNSLNLIINNKRFLIRLQAMEILPSKQQKIDYDNTHACRWTTSQWIKLVEELFYQTYGFKAMELDLRGSGGGVRRGKIFGNMLSIKNKILERKDLKLTEDDIVEYLRWAFTFKSSRCSLSMALLQCDSFIQDWLVYRSKKVSAVPSKERKWKTL